MAIDLEFRGIGLGGALLADTLERTSRSEIAVYALMVDAKDDAAARFYQHHGFIPLPEAGQTLFLSLETFISARTNQRLPRPTGYIPPTEAEAQYSRKLVAEADAITNLPQQKTGRFSTSSSIGYLCAYKTVE